MKIAVAQIKSVKGNINKNIELHKKWIHLAIVNQVDAIFFSELSITSYEPKLANKLKVTIDDAKFDVFQQLSNSGNIVIGIGAPTKYKEAVQISLLIFTPNQAIQKYAKQILHKDEFPYFTEGKEQIILTTKLMKIAPAICYESLQIKHLEKAVDMEANIYLASVAKSQKGIDKAKAYFPIVAKKYAIPILMSNCIGHCDNFESAGQSAVWNDKGILCF